MSRVSSLYDRYFRQRDEDVAELEAVLEVKVAAISEWISRPYHREFIEFVKNVRKQSEPQPGTEQGMVYSMGVRDGLDIVLDHLDRLDKEVRESRDDG